MTSRPSRPFWLALAALFCLAAPAFGSTYQIYARFGDGKGVYAGELTSPKAYVGWVALDTFSFGFSNIGAGTPSSKPSAYPISVARPVDRLSPLFLQLICTGSTVGPGAPSGVTIDYVRNETGTLALRLAYQVCYITSLQGGVTSGSTSSENLSISYGKLTMTYYQADGTVSSQYNFDFTANNPS